MYERKVTSEEEKGNFLFILKDKLNFFPSQGKEFLLERRGKSFRAMIEAIPCNCVGTPHLHYHLTSEATLGLKRGTSIAIKKKGELYSLKISQ
jgi:hypothetical protein